MQKWEYLTITLMYANAKVGWRVRNIDADSVPNWEQGSAIDKYLNELGDHGWELVSENWGTSGNLFAWVEQGRSDVQKIQAAANDLQETMWSVEHVTGFSWGATGPGGGWLIDVRAPYRLLRFKRSKP